MNTCSININRGYALVSRDRYMTWSNNEIRYIDEPDYSWRFVPMPNEQRIPSERDNSIGVDHTRRPYLLLEDNDPVPEIRIYFSRYDNSGNPLKENRLRIMSNDDILYNNLVLDNIIRRENDLAVDYPMGMTYEQEQLACNLSRLIDNDDLDDVLEYYDTLDDDVSKLTVWRSFCSGRMDKMNTFQCTTMCADNPTVGSYCSRELRDSCRTDYEQYPEACGCFVPDSVFDEYLRTIRTSFPDDLRWFQTVIDILVPNLGRIECTYPPCINATFQNRQPDCRGDYTACFQQIDLDIGGIADGSQLDLLNECIISTSEGIVGPPDIPDLPDSTTPTTPRSNHYILIGVAIFLMIVGIILLIAGGATSK